MTVILILNVRVHIIIVTVSINENMEYEFFFCKTAMLENVFILFKKLKISYASFISK